MHPTSFSTPTTSQANGNNKRFNINCGFSVKFQPSSKAMTLSGKNIQKELYPCWLPFSCYSTTSFIALSVSQQLRLSHCTCWLYLHRVWLHIGTRYKPIRTTATTLARIETHNPPLLKATHTSRAACFLKPAMLADVQLDTWDCVYQIAFSKHKLQLNTQSVFTRVPTFLVYSKSSIKQHVNLLCNKWVRKHLTHGSVWSAIVCFEIFFSACIVGSGIYFLKVFLWIEQEMLLCSINWLIDQDEFILDKLVVFKTIPSRWQ